MRRFEADESFLSMRRWLFGACGVASMSGGGGDDDSTASVVGCSSELGGAAKNSSTLSNELSKKFGNGASSVASSHSTIASSRGIGSSHELSDSSIGCVGSNED